ncbi:PQQ-dependent sugar dehydrogenase [Candidatus Roizmanbacteria bacterium]|nr:PQQ-dependent sugar dehydrogenase [Candidatus Roizmanbacteria bacterium]
MRKIFLLVIVFGFVYILSSTLLKNKTSPPLPEKQSQSKVKPTKTNSDVGLTSVVYENLDTPWAIVFLPDNKLLVTERKGTVRINNKVITDLPQVAEVGEGGLLGAAIHPDFEKNHFIYFYYTYSARGDNTLNRVIRMTLENDRLSNEKIIVDEIPGASNHNGGRLKFGPDKNLYITTGDAQNPSQAQDKTSLAGKILRMTPDEKVSTYSYGHRNPQGLAWDEKGQLYATEHGRSGLQSGLDEFNKIIEGKNYGWPTIEGEETGNGMETPLLNSGANDTWAPAGLAFYNGTFYFGGLRGQALYRIKLVNGKPELKEYFKNEFGRIRDVVLGPDNMLYISTSNQDGRGNPKLGDDKIIRVNSEKL